MASVLGDFHFAGGDSFLRSYFEQSFSSELIKEGITHRCGRPYTVKWLDQDGMIFKRSYATDSLEATLTCTCRDCMTAHHPTAYNYGRVFLNMETLMRFKGNVYDILKHEVTGLWSDLKEHLRNLTFVLGTQEKAALAEAMTRVLAVKGTELLSTFAAELDIREGEHERVSQELLRFVTGLGFVKEPTWRVPVARQVSVFDIPDAVPMPSFETRMDVLLALPSDHPLAA